MAFTFSALFEIKTGSTVTELKNVSTALQNTKKDVTNLGVEWGQAAIVINSAVSMLNNAYVALNAVTAPMISNVNALAASFSNLKVNVAGVGPDISSMSNAFSRMSTAVSKLAGNNQNMVTFFQTLHDGAAKAKVEVEQLQARVAQLQKDAALLAKQRLGNMGMGPAGRGPGAGSGRGVGGANQDLMGAFSPLMGVLMGGAMLGQLKGLSDDMVAAKLRADEFRMSLDSLGLSTKQTDDLYGSLMEKTKQGFNLPELERMATDFERLKLPIKESIDLVAELSALSGRSITTMGKLVVALDSTNPLAARRLVSQLGFSTKMIEDEAARQGGPSVVKDHKILLKTDEDREALLKYVKGLADAEGGMQKLEEKANSLQGSIGGLKSKIEETQAAIGDHMAPAIKDVNALMTSLLDKFKGLEVSQKAALGTTIALGGSMAGLTTAVAPTIYTVTALISAMRGLSAMGGMAAMIGGPIVLAAIAAGIGFITFKLSETIAMLKDGKGHAFNFWEALHGNKDVKRDQEDDPLARGKANAEKYERAVMKAEDALIHFSLTAAKAALSTKELSDTDIRGAMARYSMDNKAIREKMAELPADAYDQIKEGTATELSNTKKQLQANRLENSPGRAGTTSVMDKELRNDVAATIRQLSKRRGQTEEGSEESNALTRDIDNLKHEVAVLTSDIIKKTQAEAKKVAAKPSAKDWYAKVSKEPDLTTAAVETELARIKAGHLTGEMNAKQEIVAYDKLIAQLKKQGDMEADLLKAQEARFQFVKKEAEFRVKAAEDWLKITEITHTTRSGEAAKLAEGKMKIYAPGTELGNTDEGKEKYNKAYQEFKAAKQKEAEEFKQNQTTMIQLDKGTWDARRSEMWKFQQQWRDAHLSEADIAALTKRKLLEIDVDYYKATLAAQREADHVKDDAETARLKRAEQKASFQVSQGFGNTPGESGVTVNEEAKSARAAVAKDDIEGVKRDIKEKTQDIWQLIRLGQNGVIKASQKLELENLKELQKERIAAIVETLKETEDKIALELKKHDMQTKLSELELNVQKTSFKGKSLEDKLRDFTKTLNDKIKEGLPATTSEAKEKVASDAQANLVDQFNAQLAVLKQKKDLEMEGVHDPKEQHNIEKKYTEDVLELRQKMVDASKALTAEIMKQKALEDKGKNAKGDFTMGGIYKSYNDIMAATEGKGKDGKPDSSSIDARKARLDQEDQDQKNKNIEAQFKTGLSGAVEAQFNTTGLSGAEQVAAQREAWTKAREDQKERVAKRAEWHDRWKLPPSEDEGGRGLADPDSRIKLKGSYDSSRPASRDLDKNKGDFNRDANGNIIGGAFAPPKKEEDKSALHGEVAVSITVINPDGSKSQKNVGVPISSISNKNSQVLMGSAGGNNAG